MNNVDLGNLGREMNNVDLYFFGFLKDFLGNSATVFLWNESRVERDGEKSRRGLRSRL